MGKILTVRELLTIRKRNPDNEDVIALLEHSEALKEELSRTGRDEVWPASEWLDKAVELAHRVDEYIKRRTYE